MASHNIMVIDLELNKEGNNTTDIIQIGWCIGTTEGKLLHTGMTYVKPTKTIDPFIIELCGITDDNVKDAPTLDVAILKLVDDHKKFNCDRIIAQWGEGDLRAIREQLKNFDTKIKLPFGKRTTDVKTLYQAWAMANSLSKRSGLSNSIKTLGLIPEGIAHRADCDAINTFSVFIEILKKLKNH